jgi:hypothetical protein
MRRRLTTLSLVVALGLALGACSGDDDAKQSAEAPPATTPGATTTGGTKPEPQADNGEKAKKKKKPAQDKRISEASDEQAAKTAPEKEPTAPDTGRQEKASKDSAGGVPAGQVQATNGSPPEVTLAVIDAESAYVKKSLVRRYAEPLDQLEKSCTEAREALAEASLTASHDVRSQTGSKLSILDVLHEVVKDHPSGVCLPAFTAVAKRHGAS